MACDHILTGASRSKCEIILSQKWRAPRAIENEGAYLPDVVECVVDGTLFWFALMPVKIRLKLLFGFVGVSYQFAAGTEC
jgi:hypothetical protein